MGQSQSVRKLIYVKILVSTLVGCGLSRRLPQLTPESVIQASRSTETWKRHPYFGVGLAQSLFSSALPNYHLHEECTAELSFPSPTRLKKTSWAGTTDTVSAHKWIGINRTTRSWWSTTQANCDEIRPRGKHIRINRSWYSTRHADCNEIRHMFVTFHCHQTANS